MTVSFTGTYRVPFKQPRVGVKPTKKDALKELAERFNGIVPTHRDGNVKFSCRKKFDAEVKARLKKLGFNDYEVVDLHNVPKDQIVDALEGKGRFAPKTPSGDLKYLLEYDKEPSKS